MPGENSNQPTPVAVAAAPVAPAPVAAVAASDPPVPAAVAASDGPLLGAEAPVAPVVAAAPVAPEAYVFKAPEGQQLDTAQIEAFSPLFKELGLTQDAAQKLVDKSFEIQKASAQAFDTEVQESIKKQNADWVKQAREDKEYGGADFEKNSKIADKAFSLFATPELKQLVKESGFDRHPEIVRLFWKIGQKLGESEAPRANGVTPGTKQSAAQLYPSMQTQ